MNENGMDVEHKSATVGEIKARLVIDGGYNYAEISIQGMGTSAMADGEGVPIFIEKYEGKWTLHVWADINQEDATHRIDLTDALEGKRQGEELCDGFGMATGDPQQDDELVVDLDGSRKQRK